MVSNYEVSNIIILIMLRATHLMILVIGHDLFQCLNVRIPIATLVESQCPVAVGVSMNDVMWTIGAHGGMCGRPMTS